MQKRKRAGIVRLIGALKLLEGVVLAAAAVGLFANHTLQSLFWRVFGYWNERALDVAGVLTGVYGAVFLVEGGGLVAAQRWAEWLTVIVTTSFIPLELIKLVKHASVPGVVTLALNVAVVGYLAARRYREREGAPAPQPAPA